jgi:hypothetical protein
LKGIQNLKTNYFALNNLNNLKMRAIVLFVIVLLFVAGPTVFARKRKPNRHARGNPGNP